MSKITHNPKYPRWHSMITYSEGAEYFQGEMMFSESIQHKLSPREINHVVKMIRNRAKVENGVGMIQQSTALDDDRHVLVVAGLTQNVLDRMTFWERVKFVVFRRKAISLVSMSEKEKHHERKRKLKRDGKYIDVHPKDLD